MKPKSKTVAALKAIAFLITTIWATHLVNIALGGALTQHFGLVPRSLDGAPGIVGMHFLHGSWEHLIANTPPLLVLGGLIAAFAPDRFWRATVISLLLAGVLIWLFARGHNHIGASALIFGWFGFLVAFGVIERSWRALIGAAAAVLIYGAPSLLGLTATDARVSWDGHMAGLAAGVIAAYALRTRLSLPK